MEFQKELSNYVPFAIAPSLMNPTEIQYTSTNGNSKAEIWFLGLFIPLSILIFFGVLDSGFWATTNSGRYGGVPIGLALLGALGLCAAFVWVAIKDRKKRYLQVDLVSKNVEFSTSNKLVGDSSLGAVNLSKLIIADAQGRWEREVFAVSVVGKTQLMVLGVFVTEDAAREFVQIIVDETKLPVLEENSIQFPRTLGFVRLLADDTKAIQKRIK